MLIGKVLEICWTEKKRNKNEKWVEYIVCVFESDIRKKTFCSVTQPHVETDILGLIFLQAKMPI